MRQLWCGLIGVGIWLGLCSASYSQADGWKPLTSKPGKFMVLMPGEPKEQTQEVPTPAGKIKVTMYIVEKDAIAYFASYNDYPPELVQKSDAETMLNGARDGAVANVKGKLTDEKKIKIDAYPGRDISFEALGGMFVARSRIYLVKDRLYQVMVLAPKANGLPKEIDKYLDSFKLTK
jgi:hypothetical protein